jgi:SAM-dependent methyltransferase
MKLRLLPYLSTATFAATFFVAEAVLAQARAPAPYPGTPTRPGAEKQAESKPETKPAAKREGEFEPEVGQRGKDVVWVPTAQILVNKLLDMTKLTAKDVLYDLGSGDGRTVITAAKRGARAYGVEYNPDMVNLSRRNALKEGVADKATFEQADIFQSDFSRATVVTLFLLPELNVKLRPTLLSMKPGTRIASNSFDMGDWKPDQTASVKGDCTSYCKAYLWIVPAKVEGNWRTANGEVTLAQTYQAISGTLREGAKSSAIYSGKVDGERVSFRVGSDYYSGRVNGDTIEGTITSGGAKSPWNATRSK